jgi:hypothetical protein
VTPSSAIQDTLARLGGSGVVSAGVGTPPAGAAPGKGQARIPWLYATVRIPAFRGGLDIEPLWEADILQGAVVELSGTSPDLALDIGGSSFIGQLPDGSLTQDLGGGMGDIARGQQFQSSSSTDSMISSNITGALARFGLKKTALTILHPMGAAPAVIASTDDPLRTAREAAAIVRELFGAPPQYEGYYLELRDSQGTAFIRASAAFRTGAGRLWIDPSYENVSSLLHS